MTSVGDRFNPLTPYRPPGPTAGKLNSVQSQLLFTLLAHRYIRGGLVVTSNLNFADWTAVFNDDARLTAALLDRITHRCTSHCPYRARR